MFSVVFVFQVFRPLKVLQKFRKNYIKNQRPGSFRNNQYMAGGPPPGAQEGARHGSPLCRAINPSRAVVAPLAPSFGLYLAPAEEIPNIEVLFPEEILISAAIET